MLAQVRKVWLKMPAHWPIKILPILTLKLCFDLDDISLHFSVAHRFLLTILQSIFDLQVLLQPTNYMYYTDTKLLEGTEKVHESKW